MTVGEMYDFRSDRCWDKRAVQIPFLLQYIQFSFKEFWVLKTDLLCIAAETKTFDYLATFGVSKISNSAEL